MTTALTDAFEYLKELPFPKFAQSNALSDWQADLAELDGYIAGIATTVLGGGHADLSKLHASINKSRTWLETIQDIPAEDHDTLMDCRHYLDALDKIVQNLTYLKTHRGVE